VLSAIEALYYCTLRLFWKLRYSRQTAHTIFKKFKDILKRKIKEERDIENVQSNFLKNKRLSVTRINGGIALNLQNLQGMYHLKNQLFLSK